MPGQKYSKSKGTKKHPFQLVVTAVKGKNKGSTYRRTFKTRGEMNEYIKRQVGRGKGEFLRKKTGMKGVFELPPEQSFMKDMKQFVLDGLGFNKPTAEETAYLTEFKEFMGRDPKIWEDPFLVDRAMKFVDKLFLAMTVAAGPGIAVAGVKAGIAGTKLATSGVARAATKKALKAAIKKSAVALTKKRTVKATLKRAAKGTAKGAGTAMNVDYKKTVVKDYAAMAQKAYRNVARR